MRNEAEEEAEANITRAKLLGRLFLEADDTSDAEHCGWCKRNRERGVESCPNHEEEET